MGASSAFNANELQLANIRDTLAQAQQRSALTRDYDSQSQLRLMQMQMLQHKLGQEQTAMALDQANPPPQFGGLIPAVQQDQQQAPQPTHLQMLEQTGRDELAQAQYHEKMAGIYHSKGLFDQSKEAERKAMHLLTQATNSNKVFRLQQKDNLVEAGGIAAAITDQESLDMARPRLEELAPDFAKRGAFATPQSAVKFGQMAIPAAKQMQQVIDQQNADSRLQRAEAATTAAQSNAALNDVKAGLAQVRAEFIAGPLTNKVQAQADKILTPGETKTAKTIALKPPTKTAVDQATDAVLGSPLYEDKKEWSNLGLFSTAVADLANKIVADDASKGERTTYEDARAQAIVHLNPYVKDETTKGLIWDMTKGLKWNSTKRTYRPPEGGIKAVAGPVAASNGSPEDLQIAQKLEKSGLDFQVTQGKVTAKGGKPIQVQTKAQMQLLPPGTPFIGPDGKQWMTP